jgi:hypothetical protein
MKAFALALVACTVVGCAASKPAAPRQELAASAVGQELPPSLNGRWRYPPDGTSQVFSLNEIRAQADRTFTAKLTWWQTNPWCATRDLPIVGRQTDLGGIAFEVPRVCGVGYLAELYRSPSGWVGRASSGYGWGLALDLSAN